MQKLGRVMWGGRRRRRRWRGSITCRKSTTGAASMKSKGIVRQHEDAVAQSLILDIEISSR